MFQHQVHSLLPRRTPPQMAAEAVMCRHFWSGAAQESNLPTDGLRRLTGFEALLEKDQLRSEAVSTPLQSL